jgi:hypothetical protein
MSEKIFRVDLAYPELLKKFIFHSFLVFALLEDVVILVGIYVAGIKTF